MYLDDPNPKAFIEYSNTMADVYNNINDYNPNRERKILIVFDDMIADISLVFITHSDVSVPKEVRLNSTHYLIMKIHNKKDLENIAINHSADIDYEDLQKCTSEPYSFLTIDTTLPADNPLCFRKNILDLL